MSKEEQGTKCPRVGELAAGEDTVHPAGLLSDEDLDKVAGGIAVELSLATAVSARKGKDVIKLNCVNDKLK